MLSTFGRIGRNAELRYTASGMAVANIAFVYDYGRKGDDGKKPSQWVEIAVWGKQAEGLAQYLTKGKQVYVSVRDLHIDTFTKQDGTQSSKLVGDLADIKFASDGQPQQQSTQQQQQPQQQRQQQSQQAAPASHDEFDESIPF